MPRLLDLFCKAGGCTKGYQRAGFYVKGVDIEPQPRYCGEEFEQADAIADFWRIVEEFKPDVIHASPPCQAYSVSKSRPKQRQAHPELIEPIRHRLLETELPYVIENVPGSPLLFPVLLCGWQFGLEAECEDGQTRPLRRHRLFESSVMFLSPGCQCGRREKIGVYGNGGGWANRFDKDRKGYKGCVAESRECMGIDWMTIAELSQAIPPAYTEFLGKQLIDQL